MKENIWGKLNHIMEMGNKMISIYKLKEFNGFNFCMRVLSLSILDTEYENLIILPFVI